MALKIEDIPGLTYDQLEEHMRLSKVNADEYSGLALAMNDELQKRSPTNNYKCFKCGHEQYEVHELRAPQGFWSAFFDVQTAKYRAIVCARCKFTEFYQGEVGVGQQVADFMFGK